MLEQDYNKLKEMLKDIEIIRINNNLTELELKSYNGIISINTSESKPYNYI